MRAKLTSVRPEGKVYNGDPKEWPKGLYQSSHRGECLVLVAQDVCLYMTPRSIYGATGDLMDGYTKLPEGAQVEITV